MISKFIFLFLVCFDAVLTSIAITNGGFVETNKWTAYLISMFGVIGIFIKNIIMLFVFSCFEELLIFPKGKEIFYTILCIIWGVVVAFNFYFISFI